MRMVVNITLWTITPMTSALFDLAGTITTIVNVVRYGFKG
jgi:hypothetical protein